MSRYNLIAAIAENLLIGKDNRMPWHVSSDLKLFKKLTTDNVVIMGRKTFESIGKPLPGRKTVVITSSPETFAAAHNADDLFCADSFEEALRIAETFDREIFVAGGASVYAQTISGAERLYLSRIPGIFEGDTYFPEFRNGEWELESEKKMPEFSLEVYRRK